MCDGATPIDDLSGLKIRGVKTREQLYEQEARNISKAIIKYIDKFPSRRRASFDVTWMAQLHREMFGNVWDWAGKFRRRDVNIGVAWHAIVGELQNLADTLEYWRSNPIDLVEQAARLHHSAVHIHPFLNGNGRWSRLLADIWLLQHGNSETNWPSTVNFSSTFRQDYIQALREADAGNFDPLIGLHRQFTSS